jgi:para-nitrobenzyl esterase
VAVAACEDLDDGEPEAEATVTVQTGSGGGSSRPGTGTVTTTSSSRDAGARDAALPDDELDPDVISSDSEQPLATLLDGKIEGRWSDDGKVRSFVGIPYAEPPVDDLRWAPPQAPARWSRVFSADTFGADCVQPQLGRPTAVRGDEDCLYLNVWAPASNKRGLPVVFFIHGGDHIYGSASEPGPFKGELHFDGTALAARGVVVVTANYRLGALGFLAHGDLDAENSQSGNQGLLDQQFALQWVQDNAKAFGGDPDNVTIVGQGSGASDVCMHVAAPSSKTLFAQAISQSGGCTTYQPTVADVSRATDDWIDAVGCGSDRDVLGCLRDLPVKTLLAEVPVNASPFTAIVDGTFLTDQPRTLFENTKFKAAPYIIGSNTYEDASWQVDFETVTTEADYHAFLQATFPDASVEELCELYPHDEFGNTPEGYRLSLARVFRDAYHTCASADTAIRASAAGATVYAYDFDVSSDTQETDYVFGAAQVLGTSDRKLTELVQSYWTNFAYTGDPNDTRLVEWPQYAPYGTPVSDARLAFAIGQPAPQSAHGTECAYWSKFYGSQFTVVKSVRPVPPAVPAAH